MSTARPSTVSEELVQRAQGGDLAAFEQLYRAYHPQLKSYLYRLTASRDDAEDLAHDTFIKAFTALKDFRGEANLKTWVFQIATHLAYNLLRSRKRWVPDTKAQAKDLCMNTPSVLSMVERAAQQSGEGAFEIQDHVDHCFTCMSKTLPVEQQVAVILKDVYDFSVKEVATILDKSDNVAKHLLADGRNTLMDIFDHRCALVNKAGICHQCSELNGWFNPKQDQQQALNALDMVKGSGRYNREELYRLRAQLVSGINPLQGKGADLQDALMACDRMAMGEQAQPE
jgi:RNA polymerase sigma-70 factor (ECF subfamily)